MARPVVATVCAVALAAALIPATPFMAQGAEPVVIAKGKILKADKTAAAGMRVTAMAWPTDDVLGPMRVGTKFKMQVLDQTTTDANGDYTLDVPAIDDLAGVADWDGNVNMDVIAEDGSGGQTVTAVPLPPVFGRSAKTKVSGGGIPRPIGPDEAVAVDPITANSDGMTQAQLDAQYGADAGDLTPPDGAFDQVACTTTYKKDLGLRTSLVGAHYDQTSTGLSHDFEFNYGATATMGVGVSASGTYGSFKASGSSTNTSDLTIGYPVSYGVQHDYTYYSWGLYLSECYTAGSPYVYRQWSARIRDLAGGNKVWTGATIPSAQYCVPLEGGSYLKKVAGKAKTHTTGADVSAGIGIDLSSQSGYTTKTTVTFTTTTSSSRTLCGTTSYPGGTYNSGLIVGKS